jgi:ubiquinone/menaquinone biosynthesis C-methylase UbiE
MTLQSNPFDQAAPFYDEWFSSPSGAKVAELEQRLLLEMINLQPGERVLEAGVGTGYFAHSLVRAGGQVCGIDLSLAMLRQAASKGFPIHLVQADASALPCSPGRFDLALTITMLEFVSDPAAVLTDLWKTIRPGGRLVVAALNAWSPWARNPAPPLDQAHFFSPPELSALLSQLGSCHWSSAVFFLPDGRLLRQADLLERLGRRFLRPYGAFLVGRVDK